MGGTESTLGVATANKKWPQHLGETHPPVRLFSISHFKIEVASVEGVTEHRRRLAANNGVGLCTTLQLYARPPQEHIVPAERTL